MLSSRSNCRYIFTAAALLFTFFLFGTQLRSSTSWTTTRLIPGLSNTDGGFTTTLPCQDLPGANETLVVLKTGAGEIEEKLPIHLQTTFKCYPETVVFSDFGETFMNHTIVDVLEDVDPEIKDNHDDFDLYRKLQRDGRAALAPSELSGSSSPTTSSTGNPTVPGWTLDKYKFLPMMRKTLELHPTKKWYVFLEADTYIFWSSLLAYAAALDSQKPHYIGGQNSVGDIEFAHGGTGFLVSRPALEMVVKEYVAHKSDWEVLTREHWCGDCVLGKAFKDAGVPLAAAWPIWQGDRVGRMNYDRVDEGERRQWCGPTVSYHHLSPVAIRDLWEFEQNWMSKAGKVRVSSDLAVMRLISGGRANKNRNRPCPTPSSATKTFSRITSSPKQHIPAPTGTIAATKNSLLHHSHLLRPKTATCSARRILRVFSGCFLPKGSVCRLPSQIWESRQMGLSRAGFLSGCRRFMMGGRFVVM
jgi:hypothetical protein